MSDTDDDYSPGYKKPPKHTQWKKGQSGNPSGGTVRRTRLETGQGAE